MPGAILPQNNGEWMANLLKNIDQRLSALEFASNTGIVDSRGRLRERAGLQPDLTYGTIDYDTDGNERVRVGQLANGDYGLLVTDPAGNSAEVLPPVDAPDVDTTESTTATSYSDLATAGPLCTADASSTGRVSVVASAFIGLPGFASSNPVGKVGLFVDGVLNPNRAIAELQIGNGPGSSPVGIGATVAGQAVITGLSVGSHIFELKYLTSGLSGGQTINFALRTLSVQPL